MIPDNDRIIVHLDLPAVEARHFLVWLSKFHDANYQPKDRRVNAGPLNLRDYLDRIVMVNSSVGASKAVGRMITALASSLTVNLDNLPMNQGADVLWRFGIRHDAVLAWLLGALEVFELLDDGMPLMPAREELWHKAVRFMARNGMELGECVPENKWHLMRYGTAYHFNSLGDLATVLCGGLPPELLSGQQGEAGGTDAGCADDEDNSV